MGVGGQRHVPAALCPGRTWYPLYRRLGRPQGQFVWVQTISPPLGFDPWTTQPVAGCYPIWAIQPNLNISYKINYNLDDEVHHTHQTTRHTYINLFNNSVTAALGQLHTYYITKRHNFKTTFNNLKLQWISKYFQMTILTPITTQQKTLNSLVLQPTTLNFMILPKYNSIGDILSRNKYVITDEYNTVW